MFRLGSAEADRGRPRGRPRAGRTERATAAHSEGYAAGLIAGRAVGSAAGRAIGWSEGFAAATMSRGPATALLHDDDPTIALRRPRGGWTGRRMTGWTLVIPVKALAAAKSRLAPAVTPSARLALARAFALDTIMRPGRPLRSVASSWSPARSTSTRTCRTASRCCARGRARTRLRDRARDRVRPRRRRGRGRRAARRPARPAPRRARHAALDAAARHPLAFVRDADGTGTTLATAPVPGWPFDAARSAPDLRRREHVPAGFADLADAHHDADLRRRCASDVDTVDGLETVLHHGVGDHTAEAVAQARPIERDHHDAHPRIQGLRRAVRSARARRDRRRGRRRTACESVLDERPLPAVAARPAGTRRSRSPGWPRSASAPSSDPDRHAR